MRDDHDNALDTPPVQVYAASSPPENSNEVIDFTSTPSSLESAHIGTPIDITGNNNLDLSVSQENTRAKIALYFTFFFLFMVVVAVGTPFVMYFVQPSVFSNPIDGSKDLLTLLSSVLAGPFGFIVGFYFKQSNDR